MTDCVFGSIVFVVCVVFFFVGAWIKIKCMKS